MENEKKERKSNIEKYFPKEEGRGFFSSKFWKNFIYDFLIFFITFLLSFLISAIPDWFKDEENKTEFPILITVIIVILVFISAIIIFYFKNLREEENRKAFIKINEIMNESFQIIFSYFIDQMNFIKEATDRNKLKYYLKEINEKNLFSELIKSLYQFLNKISISKEIKIDVHQFKDNSLKPITNTFVSGKFSHDRTSKVFPIENEKYNSLAEFAFNRNLIGYIKNVPAFCKKIETNEYDEHFIKAKNLYFCPQGDFKEFIIGTLLCFPLKKNGINYGVLSISFDEVDIEKPLKKTGINIENFKTSILTFIDKYTKFSISIIDGLNNVISNIKS